MELELEIFPKMSVSEVTVSQKVSISRVKLEVRLTFFYLCACIRENILSGYVASGFVDPLHFRMPMFLKLLSTARRSLFSKNSTSTNQVLRV